MIKKLLLGAFICISSIAVGAEVPVSYEGELILNAGSGNFAPYYIASNRHGVLTQSYGTLLDFTAFKHLDLGKRFDYSFGAEFLTGFESKTDYMRFNPTSSQWETNPQKPAAIFLQQLYAEVKYRGVFLSAGMKERESPIVNFALSSGDFVESGNARPIPQVRLGFIDFQKVPFTNGWLEIQGEISYGKFADNDWIKNHFNYYTGHINLGGLYTYKRCYFRSKSSQPFDITVGMQTGGLFGGTTSSYRQGTLTKTTKCSSSFSTFVKMLVQTQGSGSDYYEGNSLGSWDILMRYKFSGGAVIKAYLEKPWEDASGIGWMNGFDGIWGLEYAAADKTAFVSGAVFEYIDFTNQSGQMHWSPDDNPGTTITSHATGGDQYYNNYLSNSYANFGLSIGTPFMPSPLYNLDGYLAYANNRIRGFHVGLTGCRGYFSYRLLGGYRKGWGDSRLPLTRATEDTSLMLEGAYDFPRYQGLRLKAQIAFDAGSMYGDNFGACLTLSYSGLLTLGKK